MPCESTLLTSVAILDPSFLYAAAPTFTIKYSKANLFKKLNSARINFSFSSKFDKITQLKRNDTITVLGKQDDWLHIKTGDGQKAFVFKTLTQSLP